MCWTHIYYGDILGLTSLEGRRTRRDKIEVFKIVRGYEDIDRDKPLQLAPRGGQMETRGHSSKFLEGRHRTAKRNKFF